MAKVDLANVVVHRPLSRPTSPFKSPTPVRSALSPDPILRPRAKINSGASVRKLSSAIGIGTRAPATPASRANSPFKPHKALSNVSTSGSRSVVDGPSPKSKVTLTTRVVARQRSLTGSISDPSFITHSRVRRGSGSLHPNDLPSSLAQVSPELPSENHLSPAPPLTPGPSPIRVKSKVTSRVTNLVKASTPSSLSGAISLPSSPSFLTGRPIHARARAPSISSIALPSVPSSPISSVSCYPITTPAPAANPHRYASLRSSPSVGAHRFQGFAVSDDSDVHYGAKFINVTSKIDPSTIPLPQQSPPTSTVSFSSRSSHSSASQHSTAPTLGSYVNGSAVVERGLSPRSSLEGLTDQQSPGSRRHSVAGVNSLGVFRVQPDDSERKIKAEAKSNRKASPLIADLEISNRSLLAINVSLEATKDKQAKEIRDLRRKLRESRLILPPRTYRAVKSSLGPIDKALEDGGDEDEDEEGDEGTEESFVQQDDTYRRVKGLLDSLIEGGKRALATTPADFKEAGPTVLSAEEVRTWRRGDDVSEVLSTRDAATDVDSDVEGDAHRRPFTPSRVAVPDDDDDDLDSEGEVEALMDPYPDVIPPALLPPITVTLS
ncbi:hypothetical protein HETIRDRAFT_377918 [Heterobasidion irregulare TC 32-1]|uniref:Uncharacterized protein n=1 Tax=Heterobasidion irregulare (strain TC 32-1) TaxID=747525 RepID=W4KQ04_HETIT|nr:uncharacterized protein HETIRDRAFT_377918 [Heterobasidion irregulare TC 32-1]ETW87141.1 hypothetical protein HETIRDRAFT_377918 [Heterobasidion irregulare TC 32-1]